MAVSSLDPNHEQKGFVNVQYLKNTMSTLHTFSFFFNKFNYFGIKCYGTNYKKIV